MAKVMISLPDDLLARIDEMARRRKVTRSGLLAQAARKEVARLTPEEMDAIIERSRARFADAGPFDSADLIRAERDHRMR
jgi:metal-responsive CopG/Arc/MetJ family transcriptional regulator